jgi:hypothetical protein
MQKLRRSLPGMMGRSGVAGSGRPLSFLKKDWFSHPGLGHTGQSWRLAHSPRIYSNPFGYGIGWEGSWQGCSCPGRGLDTLCATAKSDGDSVRLEPHSLQGWIFRKPKEVTGMLLSSMAEREHWCWEKDSGTNSGSVTNKCHLEKLRHSEFSICLMDVNIKHLL